jgi:MscS family membrane protein
VSNNRVRWVAQCLCLLFCATAHAQAPPAPAASPPAQPAPPADGLGRTTPRGTVLGFLKAARAGDYETAAEYLNTRLRGQAASDLASQLYVVLDRRLPARLNEVSDRPDGSLAFPTKPDQDLVGTIAAEEGDVQITVEKVTRGKAPAIWVFSRKTLDAIPDLFDEVDQVSVENALPKFLVETRIAQIALFEWVAVFICLPLVYLLTSLLSRALSPWAGRMRRRLRRNQRLPDPVVLPQAIRLLLVALLIRWALSQISLPLLARQFWSAVALVLSVAGVVWLLILMNGWGENVIRRRMLRTSDNGAVTVLRLGRRTIDWLAVFIGVLIVLRHFGVNVTAAVAGLGVGGIAVALAAQKTLENVIGGISIIFDQAMRVGDMMNTGSTMGVVESIGLRSTRIRTLDRTLMSVPNGQLANVQLENLSARDTFWFHHTIRLRYETPAATLRAITGDVSALLTSHALVDVSSVRVRLLAFGISAFEIEVFAYLVTLNFLNFLELQQELLLLITETVEAAGARFVDSNTVYVAGDGRARAPQAGRELPADTNHETHVVRPQNNSATSGEQQTANRP